MIEADPEHRALLDRLEDVYLEAFDLLGGDDEQDDLEAALRALQVPKREVSHRRARRRARLPARAGRPGPRHRPPGRRPHDHGGRGLPRRGAGRLRPGRRARRSSATGVDVDLADGRATLERVDAVGGQPDDRPHRRGRARPRPPRPTSTRCGPSSTRATEDEADYADCPRGPPGAGRRGHPGRGGGHEPAHEASPPTLAETAERRAGAARATVPRATPTSTSTPTPAARGDRVLPAGPAGRPAHRCRSPARCRWCIDDALLGLDADEIRALLGKLEQMSEVGADHLPERRPDDRRVGRRRSGLSRAAVGVAAPRSSPDPAGDPERRGPLASPYNRRAPWGPDPWRCRGRHHRSCHSRAGRVPGAGRPGHHLLPRRRRSPAEPAPRLRAGARAHPPLGAGAGQRHRIGEERPRSHRGLREGRLRPLAPRGASPSSPARPTSFWKVVPLPGAGAQPGRRSTRRRRSRSSSRSSRSSTASACCSSTSSGPACSCSSSASWSTTPTCSTSCPATTTPAATATRATSPATSTRWPPPHLRHAADVAFDVFQERAVRAPHRRRARRASPAPSSPRCTPTCASGCAAASTSASAPA